MFDTPKVMMKIRIDLCKLVIEESVENNAFILSSLQNTTVKIKKQISYELHVYREKLLIEEIIKTDRSSLITKEPQHKVDLRIIQKDKEIANNLHISVSTVRNLINKLFEELDVASRSQLISLFYENKLHEILNEVKMENRNL